MTVIAYRDGRLASDTQVNSANDSFLGRLFKGGKTKDGHLWAVAGKAAHFEAIRKWVEGDRKESPDEWPDTDLILITPDGQHVRKWTDGGWAEIQAEYYAWGSGADFALGAMAVGASAHEAVEAACRHDVWSSEPILVEVLGETPAQAQPIAAPEEVPPQPAETWRQSMGLE